MTVVLKKQDEWADRRDAERVDAEIVVSAVNGDRQVGGVTENVSEGGLFMTTKTPHAVGETLTIRFSLPGTEKTIEATAKVRWTRPEDPRRELPSGVGVQFVSLSDGERTLIKDFVKNCE